MLTAFINGLIGLGLSLGVGTYYLNLTAGDVLLSVFAANLSSLVAVFCTLYVDRLTFISKDSFKGSFRAWSLLTGVYSLCLLALSPSLRNFQNFFTMGFPLILSTGFAIIAFGPIQDRIVRKKQRAAQVQAIKSTWKTAPRKEKVARRKTGR